MTKLKPFLLAFAKMAVIVLVIIFGLKFWLNASTNHGQKIAVPDLSKMSLLKMKVKLEDVNLSYKILDTIAFNPDYPPLTVIEQNPEFGEYVKEDRKIYIKLNPSGYTKIAIPKFYGKTKRQMELQLRSAGFIIGSYSYVPDKGKDVVRGMSFNGKNLKFGDMIPKKSKINLVLGDGKNKPVIKDTIQ